MALWGGGRLKTLEIEDGGPTWRNSAIINSLCGHQRRQFSTYYLSTKSYCHSFNALKVLKGGGGGGEGGRICPPPIPRNEKRPRLNRVKTRI